MKRLKRNGLELNRSVLGSLHRRTHFFIQYVAAKAASNRIEKLRRIVETEFAHPWVAGVEARLRFSPGHERTRPALEDQHIHKMHWDAPITISVFRSRRKGKRLALCMSLYLMKNALHIKQLQGVPRTDVPGDLRFWPVLFIEACRTFARQEGIPTVCVPRADSLFSYNYPGLNPELSPDARDAALMRIRQNMELLYDTNATALGFIPDGHWYKWTPAQSAAGLRE